MTFGALPEDAERLEILLDRPGTFLVAPPQVRNHALEVAAELNLSVRRPPRPRHRELGIDVVFAVRTGRPVVVGGRGRGLPARGGSQQHQIAMLLRQLGERRGRVEAIRLRQPLDGFAHQLPVALGPGGDGPVEERFRLVRHHEPRIEVVGRAQPLAALAGTVRRVEREGPRRHLRHRQPARDAGQLAREELIARLERVDDDDLVRQAQRHFERFGQAALDTALHDQPIHHHVDVVVAATVELQILVKRSELAVDTGLAEPALPQALELLLELALPATDHGRQDVDPRVQRIQHHQVQNPFQCLGGDLPPAVGAVRDADVGEEQPQIVVDFGNGADSRTRVGTRGLLLDRDRRRQALDEVHVRLFHLFEELPGVRRQRLDVPPLPFRVDRVEGERGLAGSRETGDDHQLVAREIHVDVLQVVHAGPAHRDPVVGHTLGRFAAAGNLYLTAWPAKCAGHAQCLA